MERSSKKFLYIFYCNTQLWQNYGKNEFLGKNIFKTEKVRFFLRVKGKLALLVGQADRSTLRVCASSATLTEPSARVRFRPLFPNKKAPERELFYLERVKGIEPSYSAWEAAALPLSYTREVCFIAQSRR